MTKKDEDRLKEKIDEMEISLIKTTRTIEIILNVLLLITILLFLGIMVIK